MAPLTYGKFFGKYCQLWKYFSLELEIFPTHEIFLEIRTYICYTGFNECYIFSLDSLSWTAGPLLPYAQSSSIDVPYDNTFMMVSGYDLTIKNSLRMFKFDHSGSTDKWVTMGYNVNCPYLNCIVVHVTDSKYAAC